MKKLTLTAVSALALVAAGANAKNFDGFNAGVRANYNWSKTEMKAEADSGNFKPAPKGISGDLVLGYLMNQGNNFVWGTEVFAGWANYEGKKSEVEGQLENRATVQKGFNFGLDFLAGHTFTPEFLGYAKLGFSGNHTKYKITSTHTTTNTVWAKDYKKVVPAVRVGLGAKYAITPELFADFGYTYSHDLKKNKVKFEGTTVNIKDGQNHTIHLGVSYQF